MLTRDQEYAIEAYKRVTKVGEAERKRYGSMSHTLPILIRTAGLAQALSFVEAKAGTETDNNAYRLLLDDLAATIHSQQPLAQRARTAQLIEYMLLTRQTMDALLWFKRFAQSVLGIDTSDAKDENEAGGEQ